MVIPCYLMSHPCNPYNITSSIDPYLPYLFLVGKHSLGCHVFVEQGQRMHTDPAERVGPSQHWLTRPVSSVAYQLGKPHILLLVSQNHPFPMSKQQSNSHCRRGMKLFPAGDLRQQRISSLTGNSHNSFKAMLQMVPVHRKVSQNTWSWLMCPAQEPPLEYVKNIILLSPQNRLCKQVDPQFTSLEKFAP